ncbi:CDP-alcohol phosphatidyltransferase [Microbacterium panaciterrae]|uniref:Phosphoglycerol transferase MdoB n=1 Tax=Microbacterium panaciterrae TaxID=985759 RepID=A0ABP8P607_9MICO
MIRHGDGSAVRGLGQPARRDAGPFAVAAAVAVLMVLPLAPALLAGRSAATTAGLIGLPVESLVILLLLVVVPGRIPRLVLAAVFSGFVTVALVLAGIDLGFQSSVGTVFVPVDWPRLGDGYGVVADAVGWFAADLLVVAVLAAVVVCAILLARSALLVARVVRTYAAGRRVLAAATAVWVGAALMAPPFAAAASAETIETAVSRTERVLADQAAVARAIERDPFAGVPADRLLTGLRGKDVVIAFVESYGRVALEAKGIAPGVTGVLENGQTMLSAQGYTTRSAWLTSPTFGGLSWLAHATLQTGVWTDTQSAYDQVVGSDRLSLARAFGREGWNTVSDVPSDTQRWDVGTSFYGYRTLRDATDVGYRGPTFGYARVPDQYTLKRFADTDLSHPHAPLMAEIDLVSSHTPWAPLPQLVPWQRASDSTAYAGQPAASESASTVWQSPTMVQRFYGQSVQYSLGALESFLSNVDDPNLVLIVLGDHQPASIVSGAGASHDVPISIIARDPAVFTAISDWEWTPGLIPGSGAPVWRMDAFRDRLLAAFSPTL